MTTSRYLITPIPGFTPEVGKLVCMLTYARRTTLDAVSGLSLSQLDHVHDAGSNSIGALLAHITAVEQAYQASTFGIDVSPSETALDLGDRAKQEIRGRELSDYIKAIEGVRQRTLSELAKRDDDWLLIETPFVRDQPANNYFQWFHVLEDELNHRGQIRWLRKRVPPSAC